MANLPRIREGSVIDFEFKVVQADTEVVLDNLSNLDLSQSSLCWNKPGGTTIVTDVELLTDGTDGLLVYRQWDHSPLEFELDVVGKWTVEINLKDNQGRVIRNIDPVQFIVVAWKG